MAAHYEYVHSLVVDLHVRLENVKVEGRCEKLAVPVPLWSLAEEEAIACVTGHTRGHRGQIYNNEADTILILSYIQVYCKISTSRINI